MIVQNLRAELRYQDRILRFKPLHLTALTQNALGTGWLPNHGDLLYRIDLQTDRPVEIAFYATAPGLEWQALLDQISPANLVTFELLMETSAGNVRSSCPIDFAPWRERLLDFARREKRPVNRITMECLAGDG